MLIAICDDDLLFAEKLSRLIQKFFKQEFLKHKFLGCPQIQVFSSGEALLKFSPPPDLVFLDVEMPGIDGIVTGKALKKANKDVLIIIVTSYMEYLDEAMRFQVFRYLSKPLEKHRLFKNLKDAIQTYNSTSFKVAIETKDSVHTVDISKIVMIEARDKKIIVHTISENFESTISMPKWLEMLPENIFYQSHRSFIVNLAHVSDFDHMKIFLCDNQYTAYLTRRKYTAFKSAYFFYLESMR